jgi:hypothetical protein
MVNPLENTKILLVRQALWTYNCQLVSGDKNVYFTFKHRELSVV